MTIVTLNQRQVEALRHVASYTVRRLSETIEERQQVLRQPRPPLVGTRQRIADYVERLKQRRADWADLAEQLDPKRTIQ